MVKEQSSRQLTKGFRSPLQSQIHCRWELKHPKILAPSWLFEEWWFKAFFQKQPTAPYSVGLSKPTNQPKNKKKHRLCWFSPPSFVYPGVKSQAASPAAPCKRANYGQEGSRRVSEIHLLYLDLLNAPGESLKAKSSNSDKNNHQKSKSRFKRS